jgi:hypothetical protein
LEGTVPPGSDDGDVRCCLPVAGRLTCGQRSPARCIGDGGLDLGPGSCLPNPCDDGRGRAEIVCCLPGAGGPGCQALTSAQCSAAGGIGLGAGECTPNPCLPGATTTSTIPNGTSTTLPPATTSTTLPGGTTSTTLPETTTTTSLPPTTTTAPPVTTSTVAPPPTTSTTLPPVEGRARLRCEVRSDRSRITIEVDQLRDGVYAARVSSGDNVAVSLPRQVDTETEFRFDSRLSDILGGATPIAPSFLRGDPPRARGEILDGLGRVVASDSEECRRHGGDDDEEDDD